jgi:transcriptional regulator with XRE-family HTH domain
VEGGKRNPSISVLGRIVTALGVDIEELFRRHVPDGKESDAATEKPKDQLSRDLGLFDFRLWQQYPRLTRQSIQRRFFD